MYPSIITLFNISPETVAVDSCDVAVVPELGMRIDQTRRGLLPQTLQPILQKRIAIKQRLGDLSQRDCRYKSLHARSVALKWLLVVAFGYAGYKRARFGRIEAHEAITAYSREALLRAKEAAESLGYHVLHMYVDGLWVQRQGIKTKEAVQPLLDEIERRTGWLIALEGFYKWIAFLPAKSDKRVPVPNRYFGVFERGEIKVRGIELRRHNTPVFVANVQADILQRLASTVDLNKCLADVVALVRVRLAALRAGQVRPAELLVTQRLNRALTDYTVLSLAARAVAQLTAVGKTRQPGQTVRFIYTKGKPGVYAWDLGKMPDPAVIDTKRYTELALRAAHTILQPWGIQRKWLDEWVLQEWHQGHLFLAM